MEPVELNLYLKEHERCALGRGWEARRRGDPVSSNPFPKGTWQHEAWRDGYEQFVKGKFIK